MESQRITLNGKEYEIREVVKARKTLGESEPGKPVDVGGIVFRPLAHTGDKTLCLLQDLHKDGEEFVFGDNANWAESPIRKELNTEFYDELAGVVGAEHIHVFPVDLTALDGTKPYQNCEDKISLLDARQYAQYREYIDNIGEYQWLVTPWSKEWSRGVCIVYDDGALDRNVCGCGRAVRPFCILSSSILVSPVRESENE